MYSIIPVHSKVASRRTDSWHSTPGTAEVSKVTRSNWMRQVWAWRNRKCYSKFHISTLDCIELRLSETCKYFSLANAFPRLPFGNSIVWYVVKNTKSHRKARVFATAFNPLQFSLDVLGIEIPSNSWGTVRYSSTLELSANGPQSIPHDHTKLQNSRQQSEYHFYRDERSWTEDVHVGHIEWHFTTVAEVSTDIKERHNPLVGLLSRNGLFDSF